LQSIFENIIEKNWTSKSRIPHKNNPLPIESIFPVNEV